MGNPAGKEDYPTELRCQNSYSRDPWENRRASQPEETTSHQRNWTNSKIKSSHFRFLYWVAFVRKYDTNIDEVQKRTCPLVDCETEFTDQELMLKHIRCCSKLSKGLYKCFECDKEERIGIYHFDNCKDHQRTDKIATIKTTLMQAKRRLSLKMSPTQSPSNSPIEVKSSLQQYLQPWLAELPCENKLDAAGHDNPHGSLPEMPDPSSIGNLSCFQPHCSHQRLGECEHDPSLTLPKARSELMAVEVPHCVAHNYGPCQIQAIELADTDISSHFLPRACPVPVELSCESVHAPPSIFPCDARSSEITVQPFDNDYTSHQSLCDANAELFDTGTTPSGSQDRAMASTSDAIPQYNIYGLTCDANLTSSPTESSPSRSFPSSENSTFSSISITNSLDSTVSSFGSNDSSLNNDISANNDYVHRAGSEGVVLYHEIARWAFPATCDEDAWLSAQHLHSGICTNKNTHISGGDLPIIEDQELPPHISTSSLSREQQHPYTLSLKPSPYNAARSTEPQISSMLDQPLPGDSRVDHSKYRCGIDDCHYVPRGKESNMASNLKRHRNTSKRHSPFTRVVCHHPGCGKPFTRNDNLLGHQRKFKHSPIELQIPSCQTGTGSKHDFINQRNELMLRDVELLIKWEEPITTDWSMTEAHHQ